MINSIEFWEKMTYLASVVSIVGPTIVLVTGIKGMLDIFGAEVDEKADVNE